MKFGLGVVAIALTAQLALPVVAAPAVTGSADGSVNQVDLNNADNHAAALTHPTELRATPILIGHCTIWHRAQPQH